MLSQHRLVRSITTAVCAAAVNGETCCIVVCIVHTQSLSTCTSLSEAK